MISRITFCSAQPATMRAARLGPIPATSRSRSGCCSIRSNTASPKSAHQPLGIDRADAGDHPRTEIPLDPLQRGRRAGLQEAGAELQAVRAVVDPGAGQLHELAGGDHRRVRRPP